MPISKRINAIELKDAILTYDVTASPFARIPHFKGGSNVWVRGSEGPLADTRPGFVVNGNDLAANKTAYWAKSSAAGVLVASVKDSVSSHYELYWRKSAGSWTKFTDVRDINLSEVPHEGVWVGEKFYAKGTPEATEDKLCSVVFDAAAETTQPWGLLRPAAISLSGTAGTWGASANPVTVLYGLRYVFTAVSITGHESSASDPTASTGAFTDKAPAVSYTGDADTTNIPSFNVYRSADGGGAYWFLEQIANPGAGAQTYTDDNTVAGNTSPDQAIDLFSPAPNDNSNDPPPTTESGVTGTSAVERSSPIVLFGGRLYFFVGRNLYFSANDESVIGSGVLEESFPSGAYLSNRFQFPSAGRELISTQSGLWAWTATETHVITGDLRASLRRTLIDGATGAYGRRAATYANGAVAWIDQDRNVRTFAQQRTQILSTPLGETLRDSAEDRFECEIITRLGRDLLVVGEIDNDGTNTKLYSLDVSDPRFFYWNIPWPVAITALAVLTIDGDVELAGFDASQQMGVWTPGVFADFGSGYARSYETSFIRPPAGDKINSLETPARTASLGGAQMTYRGDAPSAVSYAGDDYSSWTATAAAKDIQMKTAAPSGLSVKEFEVPSNAKQTWFRFKVEIASSTTRHETDAFAALFEPDLGGA